MNSDSLSESIIIEELDLDLDPALLTFLEKHDDLPDTTNIPMISPRLLDSSQTVDKVKDLATEPEDQQKKSWHTRRREEILSLREEVTELLQILEHQRPDISFVMTQPSSEFSIASRWGDLARREVVNLQKSRQENARLKELVHYHQLQIKSIERVFKRRKRASEALMSYPLLLRCAGLSPRFHNRGVFDDLIAGMDEVYVNVDDFFTRVKMHELPCPGRRNDTIQCRERNIYLELLDCYAVPFDLQNAEKAVWTLKSTRAGESNVICSEYFDAGENTRMKSICVAVLRHGIEMRVIVHAAVRKYTEEERTIFISRTLVEPIQDVFDVTFKETQRMVLKHGKSSATGPTTVIQTHSRVIDREKMDQGIQAWEHSLTHFNHRVEDMLLRESLHSSSIDMLPNKQLKH